ncbi:MULTISPECIES: hypothetical protein [Sphingobacterium]|uniref:hypothetical protein n=1 Tax=Sphingobacterium TaxID=28453 RepID=UPI0013DA52DA|nr:MULTISPECIES: hypothetical protein [unclassified Sphingobacterium]
MFEQFKSEVVACFLEQKRLGRLPIELQKPSTCRLRKLIKQRLSEEPIPGDSKTVGRFLSCSTDHNVVIHQLDLMDLDKLRPLKNYVSGITSNPSEDIYKLLAICINFRPRPYDAWRTPIPVQSAKYSSSTTDLHTHFEAVKLYRQKTGKSSNNFTMLNTYLSIGAVALGAIFFLFDKWGKE